MANTHQKGMLRPRFFWAGHFYVILHRTLAGCFQPANYELFKQRGEAAGRPGPRQLPHLCAMLGTVRTRWSRMQDRLILIAIQMPPSLLRLMGVQRALQAFKACFCFVLQIHVPGLFLGQLQLHFRHTPGRGDSQNLRVQLPLLHVR